MKYVAAEDILAIHSELIDETGGLHGVRDVGLLVSVTMRPKGRFGGRPLYKNVFEKAAVYLEALARNHVFTDGNKRTAILVCARFLFSNGFELTATNKEVEEFVIKVVIEKLSAQEVAVWVKRHSRGIKKRH